jgi:hypothetical protein
VTPNERQNYAQEILRNPIFTEAMKEIETSLMSEWKATPPDAWKRREGLYERLQALMDFKAQLDNFIHTAALDSTAEDKHGRTSRYTV